MDKFIKNWFPALMFLIILISTNLVGLLLLLFGPIEYWKMSYSFSGQTLPDVNYDDLISLICINVISILMLLIGYFVGKRLTKKWNKNLFNINVNKKHYLFIESIFIVLLIYIILKITSILDVSDLNAWLEYNSFIQARFTMMNSLTFKDYVVIYSILPLVFCLTISNNLRNKNFIYLVLKGTVLILINLYIFQKRPLICMILLISSYIMSYFIMSKLNKQFFKFIKISLLICIVLYIIYDIGIYVNTLGVSSGIYIKATEKMVLIPETSEKDEQSDTSEDNIFDSVITDNGEKTFRTFALENQYMTVSKFAFNNLLALTGLLNRTAYASITYSVVFPEYHSYYPIDLGLDIIGLGTMPDDNLVVWKMMNPTAVESGATDAPFFIVLYSQGGIVVSAIGALVVGLCFGFFWNVLFKNNRLNIFQAGFSSLICLLSAFLAIGGGRNSLLSSYGLIWPLLIMVVVYLVCYYILGGKKKKVKNPTVCMLVTSGVVNDSRVLREAKIASENGYNVIIIGRKIHGLTEPDKNWKFKIELIDIQRAVDSGVMKKIIERVKMGFALTIHAVKNKPQIIHSNDFDTLPFGYLTSLICGAGLVYDSHEIWCENLLISTTKYAKYLVKKIEYYFVKRCDHVIAVSNAGGDYLRKLYKIDRLTIVTNCPYIDRRKLEKYHRFELLCHGQYLYDRGYEELISSAEYLYNDRIGICLRGYGEMTEYYTEMALKTKQDNIRICDKVPPFDVVYAASESHVGVIITKPVSISFKLTVSNKLFESIHAGLPVILSDVPEHRYLNEKYNFGIILKHNTVEDLVEAARKLKNDTDLYERLCQNAALAAEVLCWEKEGLKLVEIYDEIAYRRGECNEADFA